MENTNIFEVILGRIIDQIRHAKSRNILNVRGGYATGKSTFLGLLYMYLMYKYSVGEIDFIPAYFNLENDEMEVLDLTEFLIKYGGLDEGK